MRIDSYLGYCFNYVARTHNQYCSFSQSAIDDAHAFSPHPSTVLLAIEFKELPFDTAYIYHLQSSPWQQPPPSASLTTHVFESKGTLTLFTFTPPPENNLQILQCLHNSHALHSHFHRLPSILFTLLIPLYSRG